VGQPPNLKEEQGLLLVSCLKTEQQALRESLTTKARTKPWPCTAKADAKPRTAGSPLFRSAPCQV
jgi:hypothetical protein